MKNDQDCVKTLRILHLEDSPQDAELIREKLIDAGFSMQFDWAANEQEFTAFLQGGSYDLILADYLLPGFKAPAALDLTRIHSPGLPFIVVSGAIGEENAVELLKLGATDYVLKDRLDKLPLAIQRALDEAKAQTARRRAEEELQRERSLLRSIIDSTSDLIFVKNRDSVYLACNKASEQFIGLAESAQIGKSDFDFFGEPFASKIREEDLQVLEAGKILRTEEWVNYPDGRPVLLDTLKAPFYGADGSIQGLVGIGRDTTERKLAEQERQITLKYFKSMDRINQAMLGANNPEQMMSDVLEVVLSELDCDRTFLIYPCDPEAPTWSVAMERTRPEYPGTHTAGLEIPMDAQVASTLRELLAFDRVVKFGPETKHPLPDEIAQQCGFRSFMSVAIYPKLGKPWQFGVHQCSYARVWMPVEEQLLREIGRRLADGLSSLLSHRELKESEAKYRRIVDTASEGILVLGADQRISLVNARMAEMLATSTQAMIGRPMTDFVFEEDVPDHLQKIEQRRQGQAEHYERRFRRKDGATVWSQVSETPIFAEEGRFQGSFGMFTDITERKKAEAELRKLNQAIEQSPVSIVITDAAGQIEFVNATFCEITGYTREEALGQNPRIFKSGETSDQDYQRLWQTISTGGVWSGEFHNHKKDGELFWEHATIAPVRNKERQITHYVAVKEDITERRSMEEQLVQTQKMESIGSLAGGVAHDFNNMLAVILGRVQMALRLVTADQPIYKHLQDIRKSADRSADLTRQLLAFARKQVITPKVIDLHEALAGLVTVLRRLIGEDIALDWVQENGPMPVNMDPSQIDQILVNLCVNARDAIEGAGKITIATQQVDFDEEYCADHAECLPGKYVFLSVADNGRGMDEATCERIFEPFFTTKGVGEGTGLGLSTVYGIVKQNNGFIKIESALGKGSTFKVYLPRLTEELNEACAATLEESDAQGDETILVVEDEPDILIMTQQMLEDCGYLVLAAATPDEAIRVARQQSEKIHLLITDVVMPGMNGRELVDKLKIYSPKVECLYMSGYPADVIARHGVVEEGVNFIQKPFALEALTARVRKILDRKKGDARVQVIVQADKGGALE